MQNLILATSALNQTALDYDGNQERIAAAIQSAKKQGAHILTLPELAVCGYGCGDEFFSMDTSRRSEKVVANLLAETDGILVTFGVPIYHEGALYNCAVLAKDREILGITAKKRLAREGLHYEPRWFTSWQKGHAVKVDYAGQSGIDFGDLYFKVGNIGVGVEICEEAWGPDSSVDGVSGSCEIILNLSASHFSIGKNEIRRQLVADTSRALCVYYSYSNLLGVDAGRAIYDGSSFIAFNGRIIEQGDRFSYKDVEVNSVPVDLNLVRVNKIRQHSSSHIAGVNSSVLVQCNGFAGEEAAHKAFKEQPYTPTSAFAEFHNAVTLALFDYARKTRAKGYVVSLSGGCDSAATAYLVASMIHKGIDSLGLANFCEKFGVVDYKKLSSKDLVERLLTCIYQASENSGDVTENAAETLAKELGADFHSTSIEKVVSSYIDEAEQCLGRSLTWGSDDIALQNVLSSREITSSLDSSECQRSNTSSHKYKRSEASVGYTTMDGDSSGGLSPISGIDKDFLRKWLLWVEKDSNLGLGKVKAMKLVNEQQPTAELRPKSMKQTDEDDLMPYDILNQHRALYGER